ncbi:protein SOSEKI 3-like isoform X2 [Musa acuminata AAA Group]|uniref:protein SOSEKI 3-like isoform X2 n=1 Tax=Musa acuminata AAA Group TaxID=214697 RepID=UPI0031CFB29A
MMATLGPPSRTEFPAAPSHSTKCRQTPTHDDEKQQPPHWLTKKETRMDARMRRHAAQGRPERTRVWTEPPPKHQSQQQEGRKVSVVYYLSRSHHLEHPHFMEVPLSSPAGLYLRDVVDRLDVLRGKGMAAMYSWSCKRSYKNGFVWQDLSEGDLILPEQGDEYVLKGSELLDRTPPDRNHHGTTNVKIQNLKHPLQQPPHKAEEASPSSSTTAVVLKEAKHPLMQQPPPPPPPPAPGFITAASAETRIHKPDGAQEATTQIDNGEGRRNRGLMCSKEDPNIVKVGSSQPPTSSGPSSPSCAKMSTLQSLIRAELSRRNGYRNLEGEDVYLPTGSKLKAANMIMHLITCGSISVKDHYRFGSVCQLKVSRGHQLFAREPKRNVLRDEKEGTSQRELH